MTHSSIPGVILAGGAARRLGGGDKALRLVGGRLLLDRLIARIAPQVSQLALNANDDPARFAVHELPVIADSVPGRQGPLAGVLAALDWAAGSAQWVATMPGDAPFLPRDLVSRLVADRERTGATIALAGSAGRRHPVAALWPVALREDLRRTLASGTRKVAAYVQRHPCTVVEWPVDAADPFFNVNTPEHLAEADRLARLHPEL